MRASDYRPLRIVIRTGWEEQKHIIWSQASVDYTMSDHGVLLPSRIVHREYVNETLQVENLFRYKEFRRFGAETEIKFEDAPAEVLPRR